MENIILIAVVSLMNMGCFYIGAKVEQIAGRGETLKLPNPVEKAEEKALAEKQRKERSEFETNMANIEAYDGTANGQRDFE